ncbi:hypothetical protein [Streptomyces sp. Rer75]|uniref:hypothetical protein n=1 Tax=unclassified Streptomyces TaxID=2593676 RepID=UPI0015D0C25E|nr:hypothetical protein [Streptomyces sp. Rer75]QLH19473.1 hypothetical protein HYQ63_01435 [Streptomyces sp. Rer75]
MGRQQSLEAVDMIDLMDLYNGFWTLYNGCDMGSGLWRGWRMQSPRRRRCASCRTRQPPSLGAL